MPDPDQIDALATRLRGLAEDVRDAADEHVRWGKDTYWVSTSGDAAMARLADHRSTAHDAADDFEAAAGLFNAQADALRGRLKELSVMAEALGVSPSLLQHGYDFLDWLND